MSRYSGKQGRGASRVTKTLKREQAEARNAAYQARKAAEAEQQS